MDMSTLESVEEAGRQESVHTADLLSLVNDDGAGWRQ
jgi:hypothetical protein